MDTEKIIKDDANAASRSNVARETLAGGRFFGDGFFSGNTGRGLEGLAVAAGLRGAAAFGGAEEHHAPRRRGAPAAQRAPVAPARAMRVPPPRFAALTLSNGDAEARAGAGAGAGASSSGADDASETPLAARFSRTRRFGERFRARLRRGGDDGCGAGGGTDKDSRRGGAGGCGGRGGPRAPPPRTLDASTHFFIFFFCDDASTRNDDVLKPERFRTFEIPPNVTREAFRGRQRR